jgi:hypothetical protein
MGFGGGLVGWFLARNCLFLGFGVATAVSGANLPRFRGRFQKVDLRPQRALRGTPFWGLAAEPSYFYDLLFLPDRVMHRQ